tara:strand:- start:865 stop:2262 length:1398 start_codon:yes stop_codon:yes gene_type:complete
MGFKPEEMPQNILEIIRNYLTVKDAEKKLFGEVFTPVELICEMLDKLPKEVWSNPDLKWLDPANGIGNFPLVAYYRLMDGLKDVVKDSEERSKHIIENMLYMVELNPINCKACKKIFKMINGKANPNIYNSPFYTDTDSKLKENWTSKCMLKISNLTFDIIIGNPPYNQGGIKSFNATDCKKSKTVWPLFIERSFEMLKKDGFLVFLNPLSWLRVSHKVHRLLTQKHIIWLKLWDNVKSLDIIKGKIPISLFVCQNKINISKNKTYIISQLKAQHIETFVKSYINPIYSIPLAYHNIFEKILNKIEQNPELKLTVKATTVKGIGDAFILPKTYSIDNNYGVDTYTIKEGVKVKIMTKSHPDQKKTKLIIANKTGFNGNFIDHGNLGLVGQHKFYILGENLELLQRFLNTKLAKILANNTKYGQDFLDAEVFKFIPDVRNISKSQLPEINDENLAKYFGYSLEEIV